MISAQSSSRQKRRSSAGQEDVQRVPQVRDEGFTVLASPDAATLDVVFVHGLTGHPEQTWTYYEQQASSDDPIVNSGLRSKVKRLLYSSSLGVPNTTKSKSVFWPQELLQNTLPDARILTYGYDSRIGHRLTQPVNQNTILDLGQNLLAGLEAQLKEALRRSEGHREHQRDFYSVYNSTIAFMFFGTPHRGAEPQGLVRNVAETVIRVAGFLPNETLINALLPNSERLKELREEFSKMLQTKRWKVVEDSSSNLDDPTIEVTQHIAGNHMQICRFKGLEDSQYEIVAAAFGRLVPSEPVDVHSANLYTEEQINALLGSLAFERMGARLSNIRKAHHETCLWLFEQSQFKAWLDRSKTAEDHGFLWIRGKPGSGKSTIMKAALLRTKKKRPNTAIITYFFNARGTDLLERSTFGMYRSLLHQLLTALPHLQQRFASEFQTKESHGNVADWTVEEIQDFLVNTIEELEKHSLMIFIDALDECEESEVRHMVEFLEELGRVSMRFETSLNICLSSRHYPHISIKKGISLVLEYQPGHDHDIVTYVNNKLIGDEGPQMEDLKSILFHKASGVFLWVVLVVPILNRLYDHGQVDAMRKRLGEIPDELNDLFTDILSRDANQKDRVILLLQWTLFAKWPLSPVELYFAVQAGTTPSHAWNLEQPTKQNVDKYILSCSKGLTEISKSQPPIVQFIHETVRVFLLQDNGLVKLQPERETSIVGLGHARLAECCFQYFTLHPISQCEEEIVITKFPFFEYAICNIFYHGDMAEYEGVSQKNFLRLFYKQDRAILEDWIYFYNLFERYNVRKYSPEDSLLYIVSNGNMANLVRALIEDSTDADGPGSRYGNALQAACVNGNGDIARLLIDAKADVNAEGGEHYHALFAAIYSKNGALVQLLQESGACFPLDMNILHRKLLTTIDRRFTLGVSILLNGGADVDFEANVDSGRKWTRIPLDVALQMENFEIINLLISSGAKVNAQGGKALQTASRIGKEAIVRLLLEKGADVNAHGDRDGTALYEASLQGHEAIVRLLLEKGADINAQGGVFRTALQAASLQGHEAIVRLLLKKEADINAQC
ncbi:hypothetical protein MMC27_007236 [Xylographa pallens]|nr:hypothetical protein [Xylographa pallens]